QKFSTDARLRDPAFIAKTFEMSRFCLSKHRRKSLQSVLRPATMAKASNVMKVGLIRAIVQTSKDFGIENFCSLVEPWLLKNWSSLGIEFELVGPAAEYFGMRYPCLISIEHMMKGIKQASPEMWEYIVNSQTLWDGQKHSS